MRYHAERGNEIKNEKFQWDVCGSIAGDVPANNYGVKADVIPGGRCALVRHYGSRDNLDVSIYAVYREWLPTSGEEIRNFPCFFSLRKSYS